MKSLLLLLLILVGGLAAYAWFNPDFRKELDTLSDQVVEMPARTATVYKWQDSAGQWHITDTPPPAGTPHEIMTYRSDENVLPQPPGLTED